MYTAENACTNIFNEKKMKGKFPWLSYQLVDLFERAPICMGIKVEIPNPATSFNMTGQGGKTLGDEMISSPLHK